MLCVVSKDKKAKRRTVKTKIIPVGAVFSALVQNGPGAHPFSYTVVTGSYLGVKRPARVVNHTPPSSAKGKERVEVYLSSPSLPSWEIIQGDLYLLPVSMRAIYPA